MAGPYVQAATFCETAIEGKDGTLSIVKMIDRVSIHAPQDAPAEVAEGQKFNATLVIALKSDDARGRHPLRIVAHRPDGRSVDDVPAIDVIFEGDERGANIVANIQVDVVEGLYWFDVILNHDQVLTRVPLRFSYQRMPRPGGA